MFARVTSWVAKDTQKMESEIHAVSARVSALPGLVSCSVLWKSDNSGVTTAIYESEEVAKNNVAEIQEIWGGLMHLLEGAPETVEYSGVHIIA